MNLRKCPVHRAVFDEVVATLKRTSQYENERVIDELNYGLVADSVRWPLIRTWVEEEFNENMVPCQRRWFHPRSKEFFDKAGLPYNPNTQPEKFVAATKAAAGHAFADRVTPAMVQYWLERKENAEEGAEKSHLKFRASCERRGVLPSATPETPRLANEQPKAGEAA